MDEAGTLGIVPKTMTLKQQMKLVSLGAQMAAYHIEAGVRKFVDLSKRLLQDVGESIRPYLKALYKAARELPGIGEYVNEMNTDAEVDAIDVNEIGNEPEPAPAAESNEKEALEKEMSSWLHSLTERLMAEFGSNTIQPRRSSPLPSNPVVAPGTTSARTWPTTSPSLVARRVRSSSLLSRARWYWVLRSTAPTSTILRT